MELAKVVKFVSKEEEKKESKKRKSKGKGTRADGRKQIRRVVGYKENGESIPKTFYGKTLKEAEAKYRAYMAEERSGINRELQNTTVAQWADTWLETYTANIRDSSRLRYESALKGLRKYFGGMKLRDVRPSHANKYMSSWAGTSKTNITICLTVARSVFETAVDDRIISSNPFARVKKPVGTSGTHRELSEREVQWVCDHWEDHSFGAAFMIMLFAGLRAGEVLALDASDIDLAHRSIRVTKTVSASKDGCMITAPKTASSNRTVHIVEPLYRVLAKLAADQKPIFRQTKSKRPYPNTSAVSRAACQMSRAMVADGLAPIRSHDGRHTMRTMLFSARVPDPIAEEMMGHAQPSTDDEVYRHITNALRRQAIRQYEEYCSRFLPESNCGHIVVKPKKYRLIGEIKKPSNTVE